MADPMWSGGAMQLQDYYPWVWNLMSDWMKAPFYPVDPPLDPGAFGTQALMLGEFPVIGQGYAYFILRYVDYYIEQWNANPPASSDDTVTPPEPTAGYTPAYTLGKDWYALYTILYGAVSDTYGLVNQVKGLCELIVARLPTGAGEPPIASSPEMARIMSGLYYTAKAALSGSNKVDLSAVLSAITDAHATTDTAIGGLTTNVQEGFADEADAIQAVSDKIDALPTASGSGVSWPGLSGVTLSTPVSVTGQTRIAVACHGIIWTVNSYPSGQSVQPAGGRNRLKGLAWAAFESDNGKLEARQSMELDAGILVTQSLAQASAVVIYCKPGSDLTVTPWSITP